MFLRTSEIDAFKLKIILAQTAKQQQTIYRNHLQGFNRNQLQCFNYKSLFKIRISNNYNSTIDRSSNK